MRIITGSLGKRQFLSTKSRSTHPMGDRVRSAMFNMLGDISGLTVLDAYAGTGALSFEAISRGAKHATLIELEKPAQQIIQQNIDLLGVADKVTFIPGNCIGWSNRNEDVEFDLVFCDPPYDSVLITSIEKLARHVNAAGLLVLSWPKHVGVEEVGGFIVVQSRCYANATLVFYRRIR
ncbi:MAG: RsmD family RNA methyltransferase [Candidatus Saccharimonadales bacterium]